MPGKVTGRPILPSASRISFMPERKQRVRVIRRPGCQNRNGEVIDRVRFPGSLDSPGYHVLQNPS